VNILLVMADQLAPHFTGTYGHPVVQTPNLDALAARGQRFDAAYCHSPLCAPARFSFLSGQAISKIGAWDNAAEFPASVPTMAHYLRAMNYRTVLSGKMHFIGPDQLHGFEERLTTDIYPADFAWTPDWEHAEERIDKWYHNMRSLHEAGQAAWTYQIEYDEEVGTAASRRLYDLARDRAAAADERPFFMVASFIHPHDPYVARPEWWNRYDPAAIDLPHPWNADELDPHSRRIRAGIEADVVPHSEDQIRNARHGYYANTTYFDDWLGRLVTVLEETGQLDDTVIVVTADHGDMLGEKGSWFKMSFFERSARVPLVIAGPGVGTGSNAAACSHLDLLPTLLDIATDAGSVMPELGIDLEGRSLWNAASGGSDVMDETTGEYTAEMTAHPMFMIRRGSLKYIHCDGDPPLLYDLAADPEERTNLAADPAHSDRAAAFATEVTDRWDSAAIREEVLASQRSRRALHAAMSSGAAASWDYEPRQDVANAYVRNHMDWAEAGARMRYPRLEPDT
jgi:choline-sulfatase